MQPDFPFRKPVDALSAQELYDELLEDAVMLRATPLTRAVAAYTRIGKVWRIGAEAAYQRVLAEKKEKTGSSMMPIA